MREGPKLNQKKELPEERNMETVTLLLQDGGPESLARLHKWYPDVALEQMKMFSDFAKVRKEVHAQGDQAAFLRKKENPKATEEELSMGIYMEYIEPQVRDATRLMREKGYTTYESGFYGSEGFQRIGLLEHQFGGIRLSPETLDEAKKMSAEIRIVSGKDDVKDDVRDAIEIHFSKFVGLDEIKKIWDKIAQDLPDLGHVAKPSDIMGARMFREEQKNINNNLNS